VIQDLLMGIVALAIAAGLFCFAEQIYESPDFCSSMRLQLSGGGTGISRIRNRRIDLLDGDVVVRLPGNPSRIVPRICDLRDIR
jgi:hypothetical protein